ncbi:MAG: hypothetical protein LT102_12425 [Burkholderiaceae bacterium]|nr:hypothetical protein [Burkholderiaceae bacterium]
MPCSGLRFGGWPVETATIKDWTESSGALAWLQREREATVVTASPPYGK